MSERRRKYSAEQKVTILREHLKNGISVSELCEKHGIHPNLFYKWERQLFEGALGTFSGEGSGNEAHGRETARERKLEEKVTRQQEVIAWLTEENLKLKKTNGEA
jgi:transposase-like protein